MAATTLAGEKTGVQKIKCNELLAKSHKLQNLCIKKIYIYIYIYIYIVQQLFSPVKAPVKAPVKESCYG